VRAGHQSQHREVSRHRRSGNAARPRRRLGRVSGAVGSRMGRHRLIIVCGIPGAGKSTLAHRAVERWAAVSFASETFAEELGAAARTASGDLSKEAIAHAYSAMAAAVAEALSRNELRVPVPSLPSPAQPPRFRA